MRKNGRPSRGFTGDPRMAPTLLLTKKIIMDITVRVDLFDGGGEECDFLFSGDVI